MPKQLSFLQKLQVLNEAAENENLKNAAVKWDVYLSTIRKWRKLIEY